MAVDFYKPGMASPEATIAERLEARSIPEPNSGCTLWFGANGGSRNSRHGILRYKGRHWKAHRLAWIDAKGPIPDDIEVCHKCDMPECINVDHLFLGSHEDNMADMVAKGRSRGVPGEAHPSAKLTEAQVRSIRVDRRKIRLICAEYGIGKSLVSYIRARTVWKHLD